MAWEYRTRTPQLFGRSQLIAPTDFIIAGRESPWASLAIWPLRKVYPLAVLVDLANSTGLYPLSNAWSSGTL